MASSSSVRLSRMSPRRQSEIMRAVSAWGVSNKEGVPDRERIDPGVACRGLREAAASPGSRDGDALRMLCLRRDARVGEAMRPQAELAPDGLDPRPALPAVDGEALCPVE